MARSLGVAVLVAVCVLLVGCSGGRHAASETHGVLGAGQPSGAWASDAELAWLRRLASWDGRLLAGLQRAAGIESSPALVKKLLRHDGPTFLAHDQALAVADSCTLDLDRRVGRPPTPRLRVALASFQRACVHLQRFHNAIELALMQNDESLLRRAHTEAEHGAELLLTADSGLPPGEVRHSRGVAVQAEAECYAIQLAAATAERLGIERDYAAGLARLYWSHYDRELPAYRSPQCRDGGAYDLRRGTSAWP